MEVEKSEFLNRAVNTQVLRDLLTTYFKYTDQDYRDLKKILGMDPLKVTILRSGSFAEYCATHGRPPRHMNPDNYAMEALLQNQRAGTWRPGRR